LIYSGQEEPNKKRLQFFVKDTIEWKHYALASFYRTLNKLRRANPALAANADYKRIKVGDENSVFAYLRQKGNHKVLVILNFSGAEQTVKLKEAFLKGSPLNVFSDKHEKLGPSVPLHVEPWGYLLYDYNAK
jgi:alpha-amylase